MRVLSTMRWPLALGLVIAALVMPWATAGALLGPRPVAASCAGPLSLAEQLAVAPVLFVGTVTAVSNRDRVATVDVQRVWRGHSIASKVVVQGTPELNSVATSVDRTYVMGVRYLFVPSNSASPFQDSSCSATTPYSTALDRFRPGVPRSFHTATTVHGLRLSLFLPKRSYMRGMRVPATVSVTNVGSQPVTLFRALPPLGTLTVEVLSAAGSVLADPTPKERDGVPLPPQPGTRILRPGEGMSTVVGVRLRAPGVRAVLIVPGRPATVLRGTPVWLNLGGM